MSNKSENTLCDWLLAQEETFNAMRRLSQETGVEVAQSICTNKQGYAWSSPCLGTQCEVKTPECEAGGKHVATAHTHNLRKEWTTFSPGDYLHTIGSGLQAHCLISLDDFQCQMVDWNAIKDKSEEERMSILRPLAEASTLTDKKLKKALAGKPYQSEQQELENKLYEFYSKALESGLIRECLPVKEEEL